MSLYFWLLLSGESEDSWGCVKIEESRYAWEIIQSFQIQQIIKLLETNKLNNVWFMMICWSWVVHDGFTTAHRTSCDYGFMHSSSLRFCAKRTKPEFWHSPCHEVTEEQKKPW